MLKAAECCERRWSVVEGGGVLSKAVECRRRRWSVVEGSGVLSKAAEVLLKGR